MAGRHVLRCLGRTQEDIELSNGTFMSSVCSRVTRHQPTFAELTLILERTLGLIFSIQKFHKYILERNITLLTDHKPLLSLLKTEKGIPATASSRMQRFALKSAAYRYDLQYREGSKHSNADTLSSLLVLYRPPDHWHIYLGKSI